MTNTVPNQSEHVVDYYEEIIFNDSVIFKPKAFCKDCWDKKGHLIEVVNYGPFERPRYVCEKCCPPQEWFWDTSPTAKTVDSKTILRQIVNTTVRTEHVGICKRCLLNGELGVVITRLHKGAYSFVTLNRCTNNHPAPVIPLSRKELHKMIAEREQKLAILYNILFHADIQDVNKAAEAV